MATAKTDLMTAGAIAEELGVPAAKVKKALEALKIAPDAKKGACSYYAKSVVGKVKAALK